MKEIKKEEIKILESNNIVRNSSKGYVDKNGNLVGFYKTRYKRYIEDKYVDIARKMI